MTKDDLPPLPEPNGQRVTYGCGQPPVFSTDGFSESQMLDFALAAIAAHDAKREKDAERWRKLMTMSRGKVITICQRPETAFRHRPDAPWTLQEEVDAAIEREGA